MNTRTQKALSVMTQPAFLLLFVALIFAAIVPAMAEGKRKSPSGPVARDAVVDQKAVRKKTFARHHLTMPFFSFTAGG